MAVGRKERVMVWYMMGLFGAVGLGAVVGVDVTTRVYGHRHRARIARAMELLDPAAQAFVDGEFCSAGWLLPPESPTINPLVAINAGQEALRDLLSSAALQ